MEFLIEGISPNTKSLEMFDGSLWMEIPSRQVPTMRNQLSFELGMSNSDEMDTPPPQIDQAMASLNFYRMQEQARTELEGGNFEAATRRLKNLASQLLGDGEYKLATKILNEASFIENGDLTNDELRKEVKYGTRALLLPPGHGLHG
jgi:Ca-activated chloride channel family protein